MTFEFNSLVSPADDSGASLIPGHQKPVFDQQI